MISLRDANNDKVNCYLEYLEIIEREMIYKCGRNCYVVYRTIEDKNAHDDLQ